MVWYNSFISFQQYYEEMIASPETDENEVETDRIDTANTNIKVDSADIKFQKLAKMILTLW